MAKKKPERKPDLTSDESVEERVRRMLDPSVPDEQPTKPATKVKIIHDDEPADPEVATAPEIGEMPVPKEPLKIKILHDQSEEPPTDPEPKSAPVLDGPPPEEEKPEPEPKAPVLDPETLIGDAMDEHEDAKTSMAVDDIVAKEGDELLKAEDDKVQSAFKPEPPKKHRIRAFFAAWWANPIARWATIFAILLAVVAAVVVPTSRYFVLNSAGVRSSLSIKAVDESTLQPLKNVKVSVGDASAVTNADGVITLEKVKLGAQELKIEKRAFAEVSKKVTVGWGSNPLGDFQLKPVGTQYTFVITDFLSGKGISKAEVTSGEASAVSDDQGRIKLTMDEPPDQIQTTIKAKSYRDEQLAISADSKAENPVKMVPARKEVFVSKRSGKFDLFKVDIDGKNEELVLAGTGTERDDMVLVPHATDEVVALVSTREGKRNPDGYLQSTLSVVSLEDNAAKSVVSSERVQVLGWEGDRVVYVQVAAGASAADPKRHRLMSYDYKKAEAKELAAANYFNDVMIAAKKIYYAPSSAYQNGVNTVLFKIEADGTNRQPVLNKEAWNLFRTSYERLAISAPNNEWYEYQLGDKEAKKLTGEPANLVSRVYVDGPDNKKSLWVDTRDGKGVLVMYDVGNKEEKVLRSQSGLKNPTRWLSSKTVVFRINTPQETADYAIGLDGGEPKKIRDVTNTGGIDRWYYY